MSDLKNNRWLPIATMVLLVANIITLVLLWTNRGNDKNIEGKIPPPQGQVFEFLTKELQLDAKQQEAYAKLRDEHQAIQRQNRDSLRKAKDELFSLLQQPGISDSVVREYSSRATAIEEHMDIITFKHFQQVRILCNPDQQKKFDSIISDVLKRMAPGPIHGPPPPGMKGGPGEMPPPPEH